MTKVEPTSLGNQFGIDKFACFNVANMIRTYQRPHHVTRWGHLPPHLQLSFKVAFIAICHQFNWDFLQNRLADVLLDNPDGFVDWASNVKAHDITNLLEQYSKPERIRASERARLLKNVGSTIKRRWHGSCAELITESAGRCAGPSGLLNLLDEFQAYRVDPLRKKSHVLIHDLVRENILIIGDQASIEPAIDYHIMRIYLRTGRVVIKNKSILPSLQTQSAPESGMIGRLRQVVSEAVKLTAFYSGLSVADVNYIDWQLGRSICTFDSPGCDRGAADNLPEDLEFLSSDRCPFNTFCEAKQLGAYGFLVEPQPTNKTKTYY